MNKYYRKLDIDVSNALIDKQSVIDRVIGKTLHEVYAGPYLSGIVNKSWLDYMESLGLAVNSCVVFSKEPHAFNVPRIDLLSNNPDDKCIFSCDFALTSSGGILNWYEVPSEPPVKINSPHGTNYLKWIIPYENAVESYSLDSNLVLVNTSEPHNTNCGAIPEVSVSFRFKPIASSWDEAVALFAPHTVNE